VNKIIEVDNLLKRRIKKHITKEIFSLWDRPGSGR